MSRTVRRGMNRTTLWPIESRARCRMHMARRLRAVRSGPALVPVAALLATLLAAVHLPGCAMPAARPLTPAPVPAASGWTSSASVVAADQAFATLSAREGPRAAFAAFAAEDARWPMPGTTLVGKSAIVASFDQWPAGARLLWTPLEGLESADGTFGVSWGTSQFIVPGQPARAGRYLTAWRRAPGGAWQFVADMGVNDPLPQP